MMLAIQLVVAAVLGIVCAMIAHSRGRNAVGWFFIGAFLPCFGGLILVLVLPDLKAQQERERRLADENRRLRERLKKDRMVADDRHAELTRRVVAHDVALGVDTGDEPIAELPGAAPAASAGAASPHAAAQWYWAQGMNRSGPVDLQSLRALWADGSLTAETLVWSQGMARWSAVRDVSGLVEALDG